MGATHSSIARSGSKCGGVSITWTANRKTLRGSIELDGSRHDDVTRVQSGMIAAIENLSRMVLLNNNAINVNSPMRGSGPDNM